MTNAPLLRAIKILGSRKKVAKLLEITPTRLAKWLNAEVNMGYEYALAVEYLTHGQVKAMELVPEKARLIKNLNINLVIK